MKKIIKINASSLPLSKCILHWHRVIIQGYKTKVNPAAVIYGVAGHAFINSMFKTNGDLGKSVEAYQEDFNKPKDDNKVRPYLSSDMHLRPTLFDYWDKYISKDTQFEIIKMPNGEPATEITFEIPYYEDNDFIVLLCGTIDKLGKFNKGPYAIGDYKFTSCDPDKGYLEDYEMSQQLRFYVLSLKLMGQLKPDSFLGKIGNTKIGAFIDGVFISKKVYDNQYRRSQLFMFTDEDLKEFRSLLDEHMMRLLNKIRTNTWQKREGIFNGACQGKFSKCEFWNVCSANNPKIAEIVLSRDFRQIEYNPLKHQE